MVTSAVEGMLSTFGFIEEAGAGGGEAGAGGGKDAVVSEPVEGEGAAQQGGQQGGRQGAQQGGAFFSDLFDMSGQQTTQQQQRGKQEHHSGQGQAMEGEGSFFMHLNSRVSDVMSDLAVGEGASAGPSTEAPPDAEVMTNGKLSSPSAGRVVSEAELKLQARVAKFKAMKAKREAGN
jgi:hypothetical protein